MQQQIQEKNNFISEFNDGLNQVLRLNNIWAKCHHYASVGNLIKYKWELDRAWVELSAGAYQRDENLDGDKKYTIQYTALNKKIVQAKENNSALYTCLIDKEIFLRILAKKLGLGTKDKPQDDDF